MFSITKKKKVYNAEEAELAIAAIRNIQESEAEDLFEKINDRWDDVIDSWDMITEMALGNDDEEDDYDDEEFEDDEEAEKNVEEDTEDDSGDDEKCDSDNKEDHIYDDEDAHLSITERIIKLIDDDDDEDDDEEVVASTKVSKTINNENTSKSVDIVDEIKPAEHVVKIKEEIKTTEKVDDASSEEPKTETTVENKKEVHTIEPYSMMSNEYRNILKSDTKPLNASKRTNPVSCFNNSIHTLLGVLKDNNIEDFMKEIPSKYEGVEVTDECITGKQFVIFNNMKSDESIDIMIRTSLNYVPQSMPSQVKADFGASVYVPDGHKNIYVLDYVNKIAVCGIRMVGGKNAEISMSIFPKVDKD